MGNRSRSTGHGEYKRGYRRGVLDAIGLLVATFDDIEYTAEPDGTERSAQCYGCLLKSRGYDDLADLFRHTTGQAH